tara:strand:- start:705 stop:1196 length:492 start_codon:yes stop_codon:yes gene_type:complete
MNKFSTIVYPFFGIKHKPWNVIFDLNKIQIQRTYTGHLETVDDKRYKGDYFARLTQMEQRIKFEYTCKNLQEVIFSGCKWGMDRESTPHDLSQPLVTPTRCAKVVKVNENLVWLKNISYPFEIPTNEKLELKEDIFGTLVKVDNEWYLKEFSYEPTKTVYARI